MAALASLSVVAALALALQGRLPTSAVVLLAALPLYCFFAVARPAAIPLAFIALPPGVVGEVPGATTGIVALVAAGIVAIQVLPRPALARPPLGIVLFGALIVAAAVHARDELTQAAARAAHGALAELVYYAVLLMLGVVLLRRGAITAKAVAAAIVLSAVATAIIFLVQAGARPAALAPGELAVMNPGLLDHRTHFGYFAALGFGVAFSQMITARQSLRPFQYAAVVAATVTLALAVAISLTRGAWIVSSILLLLIPGLAGRRGWWLLVPAPMILLSAVSLARERAFGDFGGGLGISIRSGVFGSGRAELWDTLIHRTLELPWGGGFGTIWSYSPFELFGMNGVFVSGGNPFVYAHNDFLYLAIELGVVGVVLLAGFWMSMLRALLVLTRCRDARGVLLLGPCITMLVAELVDNGLAMRGLSERFFLVAGLVLAAAASPKEQAP